METTRLAALLAVALTLAGCAGTQHNGRGARVSPPFPRPYAVNPAPALRDHGAALISARTGKHRFLSARIRGAVADGAGGWFVATASGIARMRSDGIIDPRWRAGTSTGACEIVRGGSTVYAVHDDGRVAAFGARSGAPVW